MSALFFPHSYAFVPERKIGTWFAPGVHVQQKHHGEAFRCAADALEQWLCDDPTPTTYTSAPAPQECELCASTYMQGRTLYVCAKCGVYNPPCAYERVPACKPPADAPVSVPVPRADPAHFEREYMGVWEQPHTAGWCQECDSVVLRPHDPTHTVFSGG